MPLPESAPLRILGRYALYEEIAAGGMATVHFGRLIGPVGFSRTVAIKRLHPQYAKDPEFVSMFLDEARLAARIRHPNVVPTLDVVAVEGELFLVMEYVEGESLARVISACRRAGDRLPVSHAVAILSGALYGLHAAHEATSERGEPLELVHRDMSPQNVLVGVDGVPRVLDFGVAKAAGRLQTTREGQLKGKIAYMAPEQLQGGKVDRRVDVFAAGVVLWEALTGLRLFRGETDVEVFGKVLQGHVPLPSSIVPDIPPGLDAIVLQSLARAPADRFESAHVMARALERSAPLVPSSEIADFVARIAAGSLAARAQKVALIEESSEVSNPAPRASRADSGEHPGTRVIPRGGAAAPVDLADTAETPSLTQLSSGSMSQPRATAPPRRGVPIPAFAALAICSLAAIGFLALRHGDPPPAAATTWTEPATAATAPPTPHPYAPPVDPPRPAEATATPASPPPSAPSPTVSPPAVSPPTASPPPAAPPTPAVASAGRPASLPSPVPPANHAAPHTAPPKGALGGVLGGVLDSRH
jgi:serine/threonine-protein kinase